MNNSTSDKNLLHVLYYMATTNQESEDSFVHQYLKRDQQEGIPIGKLFFWIKGAWETGQSDVNLRARNLYKNLMGVTSLGVNGGDIIGPFQNIEELRRFSYLLCQEIECHQVKLFSVDELNEMLKVSTSKTDLLNLINDRADSLENLDLSKSKSFFNKILSRG